jgi:hypothetical protein
MITYQSYQAGSLIYSVELLPAADSRRGRLYTNDDDVVYSLMRAIGFNGINLAATRPDLLDRLTLSRKEIDVG